MTYLQRLRIVLALAGLIFAVSAVATDSRTGVWMAIGLLGLALLIGLVLRKKRDNQE